METTKKYLFEYIVDKLLQWNFEVNQNRTEGMTKLKIVKLHFFVCAISTSRTNSGLLNHFDAFHALPLGHVESEVYSWINSNALDYFTITKDSVIEIAPFVNYKSQTTNVIDNAINSLKTLNPDLINYKAFDLVELSHLWSSWSSMFGFAQSMGKQSIKIPSSLIQGERKIFSL
jgi:uncharacterized phage-associated protein